MKVTLINSTPMALETLLFTRSTRLQMSPGGFAEICAMPEEKKLEELEKARNTIQSSWEFIHYMFSIEGVGRGFTHQFVRTRTGSYAQQSQRLTDMSNFGYHTGESIAGNPEFEEIYGDGMLAIRQAYHNLVEKGADKQDARGILPTDIHTNIAAQFSLRSLHEMGLKRLCVRTQGEYQQVFRAMRDEVLRVHPWARGFIKAQCAWNGVCAFPLHPVEQCPVKHGVYDPTAQCAYDGGDPISLEDIEIGLEREQTSTQPR